MKAAHDLDLLSGEVASKRLPFLMSFVLLANIKLDKAAINDS